MKSATYALSLFLAAAAAGPALGDCTDGLNKLSAATLTSTLSGSTACNPVSGPFENQEFHQGGASGTLIDFKKGPTDPTDPSSAVGTYTISGTTTGTVTYTYGSGGTFSYTVTSTGTAGQFDFCGPPNLVIRVVPGNSGCA